MTASFLCILSELDARKQTYVLSWYVSSFSNVKEEWLEGKEPLWEDSLTPNLAFSIYNFHLIGGGARKVMERRQEKNRMLVVAGDSYLKGSSESPKFPILKLSTSFFGAITNSYFLSPG